MKNVINNDIMSVICFSLSHYKEYNRFNEIFKYYCNHYNIQKLSLSDKLYDYKGVCVLSTSSISYRLNDRASLILIYDNDINNIYTFKCVKYRFGPNKYIKIDLNKFIRYKKLKYLINEND